MGVRGRRSAASLTVISGDGIAVSPRPSPPVDLSAEMGAEWRLVVNRMRADWFTDETLSLLRQYCRHVVAARRVAELIAGIEAELAAGRIGAPRADDKDDEADGAAPGYYGFTIKDYDRLLKMQERESRAIKTFATSMRLSQQSTYDKNTKKGAGPKVRKPWQTD